MAVFNVDSDNEVHPSRRAKIAHLKMDEASLKYLANMLILQMFFHQNWQ